MSHPLTRRLKRAALLALATLALLVVAGRPFTAAPIFAQSAPPPEMVDWQVERTPDGFEAYWEFSPRVAVYLNLYRRDDGVNVASQDLGTGSVRGSGVYRYTSSLSSLTVKPDEEYTLDVVAEDLADPGLKWRFTFLVPEHGEGDGLFSGVAGWLRSIKSALDPRDWTVKFMSFGVATTGRGINQFLCDLFSWASGQTPETCTS